MTIAMILEMLSGKIGCISGKRFDATAFEDCDESDETTQTKLENLLVQLGYPRGGEEMFMDGRTGKMFLTPLFIGTCYYQRLKHMVEDKIHSRAKGPVHIMTHQPIDGRLRDGGLRFGTFIVSYKI
jgi:DNA-directed RNA polymerase beta subunit